MTKCTEVVTRVLKSQKGDKWGRREKREERGREERRGERREREKGEIQRDCTCSIYADGPPEKEEDNFMK